MSKSNALVVDTSTSMRNYVREILHQELGFNEIHAAKDADDAFRVLKSGHVIDWIFSSWEMPGLSTHNLLEIVRSGPQSTHTRFVLMSANNEPVTREIAIREGATDYLCKPFTPHQLTHMVHRLTGLAERRDAKRFKVARPCEINLGLDSFHHYGAELADISMTGCRIKTSQVEPGDDYATITLSQENDFPFHIKARITRVELSQSCADPLRNTEMAVEFINVTPPVKEKLESFIHACRKPDTNRRKQLAIH
jgi:CheY-like chemotaxis protein